MRVSEVMSQSVEYISPEAPLDEAAAKMKALDVGFLPVCKNDHIVGMVTDRDITVRATAEGEDPKLVHVGDIMTANVVYCFDDELVDNAAQIMQQNGVRRLVVLNHTKRLVGVVSLGDLAVESGDEELVGNTLDTLCAGKRHPIK
jgi:CBS domain-containing protein